MKLYLLTLALVITGLSFDEETTVTATLNLTAEQLADRLKQVAANGEFT